MREKDVYILLRFFGNILEVTTDRKFELQAKYKSPSKNSNKKGWQISASWNQDGKEKTTGIFIED